MGGQHGDENFAKFRRVKFGEQAVSAPLAADGKIGFHRFREAVEFLLDDQAGVGNDRRGGLLADFAAHVKAKGEQCRDNDADQQDNVAQQALADVPRPAFEDA